jgi:hypothetical protein
MRQGCVIALVCAALLMAGCSHQRPDKMKASLDKIRAMVAQSALMSAQAACSNAPARAQLIDGALALLRRATAGPEMMKIHQMMGEMSMDKPGDLPAPAKDKPPSPDQAMHIAVHSAGGDGFDLLDSMTRPPGLTCEQVRPVGLAATAALLRQHHEQALAQGVAATLDKEVDGAADKLSAAAAASVTDKTPDPVRTLALALQKI